MTGVNGRLCELFLFHESVGEDNAVELGTADVDDDDVDDDVDGSSGISSASNEEVTVSSWWRAVDDADADAACLVVGMSIMLSTEGRREAYRKSWMDFSIVE